MHHLLLAIVAYSAYPSASSCDFRCVQSIQQRRPDKLSAGEISDLRRRIDKLIKECDRLHLEIENWLRKAEERTEKMKREIREDDKLLKDLDRKLEQRKTKDKHR